MKGLEIKYNYKLKDTETNDLWKYAIMLTISLKNNVICYTLKNMLLNPKILYKIQVPFYQNFEKNQR